MGLQSIRTGKAFSVNLGSTMGCDWTPDSSVQYNTSSFQLNIPDAVVGTTVAEVEDGDGPEGLQMYAVLLLYNAHNIITENFLLPRPLSG